MTTKTILLGAVAGLSLLALPIVPMAVSPAAAADGATHADRASMMILAQATGAGTGNGGVSGSGSTGRGASGAGALDGSGNTNNNTGTGTGPGTGAGGVGSGGVGTGVGSNPQDPASGSMNDTNSTGRNGSNAEQNRRPDCHAGDLRTECTSPNPAGTPATR